MSYIKKIFNHNFLEYASYLIKDRAIPDIDDGLKPVQRRILHSLFEMDDGKFNKVANVVGHCMKYHPHGDASIYAALVVLANKDLFIEKQGNFGNILTGDQASAARYIECRILPLAKKVLYSPEITEYEDSYDGRNKEPVKFPAKIPVVLIQGTEGIAVGMATKILPHNYIETLEAVISSLKHEKYRLYPDFASGGLIDVSFYEDGLGKVLVRAKLDTRDPKKIVIRELPFGSTTESLIGSIEAAAKKNKIKISGIDDFTTGKVEIEVKLARGVHVNDIVDSLYAFTDCESSISVNLLVIKDNMPVVMTVSEIIQYHAEKLVELLKAELKIEQRNLKDRLHARTLERIFIEERIYKRIEKMKTHEGVIQAVLDGFVPFYSQIKRDVTEEDVERLLKIPIRRISLYDINKAKKEMEEISRRLTEIADNLKHIKKYAVSFLNKLIEKNSGLYTRRTEIVSFQKTDVRDAAQRNLPLCYDSVNGYLGYDVRGGKPLFNISVYDRILIVRKSGVYSTINVPEKIFVDKGLLYCGLADKEILSRVVFSIIYKDKKTGFAYLKRCRIEKYILEKGYLIVPEACTILKFTIKKDLLIHLFYKPKPRLRVLEEKFELNKFLVKGVKAAGVKLSSREIQSVKLLKAKNKIRKEH